MLQEIHQTHLDLARVILPPFNPWFYQGPPSIMGKPTSNQHAQATSMAQKHAPPAATTATNPASLAITAVDNAVTNSPQINGTPPQPPATPEDMQVTESVPEATETSNSKL